MKQTNIQKIFDAAKKIPVDEQRIASGRTRLANHIALRPIKGPSEQVTPQRTIPLTYLLKLKPMIPLILIVAVLFGGGGAVVAAQNDLPGDALYGVKIATENVKEALALSSEKKAEAKTKSAAHRTEELAILSKQNDKPSKEVVTEITKRFQKLLKEINDLTSQLTPEQKLQLTPEVTALVSSSLHDLNEARVAGTTSTHAIIDEAVQSTLQAELKMSEHEESAVKEQPSLTGLQERAQHKINEVTRKVVELKKDVQEVGAISTSTTAMITEAETALADAQAKFAAGAYVEAFTRAGDAHQAAIKAKQSLKQSKEASDDKDNVEESDADRNESDRDNREKKNEDKKRETEKLRETNRASSTVQDGDKNDNDNEVDD